jgi:hypothetical protein
MGTVTIYAQWGAAVTAPGAPTNVQAVAGNGQATITFTPPVSDGGSPILDYIITAYYLPFSEYEIATSSPYVFTGLDNGTAYTFTVTARNSVGTGAASSASNPVTPTAGVTVTAPVITTTSLSNVNSGTAYSQTLTATGGGTMTWNVISGSLPTGLTLNTTTGAITGTPSVGNTTTFDFTVQAQNSAGSTTQALSITVTFGVPPTGVADITAATAAMLVFIVISVALWGYILRRRLIRGTNG